MKALATRLLGVFFVSRLTPGSATMQNQPVGILGGFLFLLLACGCGKSGVKGKVTLDNSPVAAGWITFEAVGSNDSTFSGNIHEGQYKIEKKGIEGQYKVKIDVHFVNANEAADYYAKINAELNQDTQDEKEKKKIYEFQEELSSGSNVKDFQLQQ